MLKSFRAVVDRVWELNQIGGEKKKRNYERAFGLITATNSVSLISFTGRWFN